MKDIRVRLVLLIGAAALFFAPWCGVLGRETSRMMFKYVGGPGQALAMLVLILFAIGDKLPGLLRRKKEKKVKMVPEMVLKHSAKPGERGEAFPDKPAVSAEELDLRFQKARDVRSALKELGFRSLEISTAMSELDFSLPVEVLLKTSIRAASNVKRAASPPC
jgi:hypothetical protein